jgi:hypothetical protein
MQQQAQASQPVQQQQAQSQQAQSQQTQSTSSDAQTMALQALAGLDSAEAATPVNQASAQSPAMTGEYSASLQTLGATVRLRLNADGSFAWIVTTKDGKSSSYQGSFTLNGGRLTLARTDNTKFEASITPTTTGFSLKAVGQNASTLSFVRV